MSFEHEVVDCRSDIAENAERIRAYVAGVDRAAFEQDGRTRDAVERCLERICEAAARLGARGPALMPSQPWAAMRGMGNRLRHAYHRIDAGVIWETTRRDLPGLEDEVRRLLAGMPDPGRP